jgi:hypothetical protein
MDDSFSIGQTPKKRRGRVEAPPRHAAPGPPASGRPFQHPSHARKGSIEQTRLILGGIGLVVVAIVIWGFMHFMASSGEEAATGEGQAIGRAQDVQAQLTGTSAIQSVEALYAQNASFETITPQALKAFEPTFTYTDGESTGPNTVAVKATSQGVGLAVRSESGTCLYAHVAAAAVTYGSGAACTGAAALDATSPAWPTPA